MKELVAAIVFLALSFSLAFAAEDWRKADSCLSPLQAQKRADRETGLTKVLWCRPVPNGGRCCEHVQICIGFDPDCCS